MPAPPLGGGSGELWLSEVSGCCREVAPTVSCRRSSEVARLLSESGAPAVLPECPPDVLDYELPLETASDKLHLWQALGQLFPLRSYFYSYLFPRKLFTSFYLHKMASHRCGERNRLRFVSRSLKWSCTGRPPEIIIWRLLANSGSVPYRPTYRRYRNYREYIGITRV